MSFLWRDGARKKVMSFRIVSPADGMTLPVHPRDFGMFPRQLFNNNSLLCYRSSFDEIMAPYRSPTMRVGGHPTRRAHSSSAEGGMIAHLQEAAIVETVHANEDRLTAVVVVDAATARTRGHGHNEVRWFFAYADNYLIDVKYGIIMEVEASRAIRQAEVGASRTMLKRTEACFGIKPAWLVGDTAYGFSWEDFAFDDERDIYTSETTLRSVQEAARVIWLQIQVLSASTRDRCGLCRPCARTARHPLCRSRRILRQPARAICYLGGTRKDSSGFARICCSRRADELRDCEKAPNTDPGVNQAQSIDVIVFSRRTRGPDRRRLGPHPLSNFTSHSKKVTQLRVGSALGSDSNLMMIPSESIRTSS
jgi:hypothetical protein